MRPVRRPVRPAEGASSFGLFSSRALRSDEIRILVTVARSFLRHSRLARGMQGPVRPLLLFCAAMGSLTMASVKKKQSVMPFLFGARKEPSARSTLQCGVVKLQPNQALYAPSYRRWQSAQCPEHTAMWCCTVTTTSSLVTPSALCVAALYSATQN